MIVVLYERTAPGLVIATAVAPVPEPPDIVITGGSVYPSPALITSISTTSPAVFTLAFNTAGVVAVQAWINAGNTNTTGLDFVLNWRKDNLNLGFNGNLNKTTIDSVDTPAELGSVDIFSHKERSLITNSRPRSKVSLTLDYTANKFDF